MGGHRGDAKDTSVVPLVPCPDLSMRSIHAVEEALFNHFVSLRE
jgi:hypothetical protein